jgi:hypothetical protein
MNSVTTSRGQRLLLLSQADYKKQCQGSNSTRCCAVALLAPAIRSSAAGKATVHNMQQ